MIVLHIIPVAADRTLETYDFFLETSEPDGLEKEGFTTSIRSSKPRTSR